MEILEHIKARRTIRSFKPDPVPQPVLDEAYEAAMWAPSPGNLQPWDFLVVGPETRGKILALFQAKAAEMLADPDLPPPKRKAVEALREDFGGAPYMVAVVCRASDDPMLQHENQLSVATAVQNLCLVASAHGVGSIWLSVGAAPPVKPLLGLEQGASVGALLALGYPKDTPPAPPREDYKTHLKQLP